MKIIEYCAACLVAAIAFWPQAAAAESVSIGRVAADYTVTVAGLKVMEISFGANSSGSSYRAEASIKSDGLSAVFSDYSIVAEAAGQTGGDGIQPQTYSSFRQKGKKEKSVSLAWSAEGRIVSAQPFSKKIDVQKAVEAALTPDTLDPLSAVFRIGAAAGTSPCVSVYRVFDGRDVFDLRLDLVEEADASALEIEAYHGRVQHCRLVWEPVAGRSSPENTDIDVYDVWMAPLGGDRLSERAFWLPVMASGRLKGIRFVAAAAAITVNP